MSWAEFLIHSHGFAKKREYEMMMVREIAYEVHGVKYMFGKKRPPTKHKFWPIEKKPKSLVTDKAKEAFLRQLYEYKKNVSKNGGSNS